MSVKFLIDEILPLSIVTIATSRGHDAVHARDAGLRGRDDAAIAQAAQNDGRALVTMDSDFADIRTYPPGRFSGVVVLNPEANASVARIESLFTAFLSSEAASESLAGKLLIVDPGRVRVRTDTIEDETPEK